MRYIFFLVILFINTLKSEVTITINAKDGDEEKYYFAVGTKTQVKTTTPATVYEPPSHHIKPHYHHPNPKIPSKYNFKHPPKRIRYRRPKPLKGRVFRPRGTDIFQRIRQFFGK